ncbi:histone deacetylase [Chondromyces crocatus]|uniref:Histone deacetylase n=2 Tax=Chondromyces crocatus TaxID=52 RepID=A0A0K1EC40_CHOCO|nr:histone deacetylase [Chondromyces crocatus]
MVDDPLFDEHQARGHHPERPERLAAARRAVERCVDEGLRPLMLTPRDATDEEILRAHEPAYLKTLQELEGQWTMLDADTYLSPVSLSASRRAAGGALSLVDALLDQPSPSAAGASSPSVGFALLRPPGHHATRRVGMGFCLLDNVAIAAYGALQRGLQRVAIVDWDVHHGNGTQDIFWQDPRVLFISLHQWPFYPGTGMTTEVGEGEGRGYTVNVPLSEGANDAVYCAAFDQIVLPVLAEYAPELILVSAGYDAHERDPLASMRVTASGYGSMTKKLRAAARTSAEGRLGLILEGGYSLTALETSVAATLRALTADAPEVAGGDGDGAGRDESEDVELHGPVSPRHQSEIDRARRHAQRHWPNL